MGFRSIGSSTNSWDFDNNREVIGYNDSISVDGTLGYRSEANPMLSTPRSRVRISRPNINDSLGQRIEGGDKVEQSPMSLEDTIRAEGEANRQQNKEIDEKNTRSYRNEKLVLAGAQFGLDIMNASTQYRNVEGQARFAIIQSRNQAADALYRGRQAAFDTQSEGRDAGEDALLALAAQGQDVQGAGAERIVRSYEGIAEQNAAIVEANAMREALGFKLEEIAVDYQLENARINRDQQYISSALTFGAQAAGAFI